MNKLYINRAVKMAETKLKGTSSGYMQAYLYAAYGGKIGIGWCAMIGDAYGS